MMNKLARSPKREKKISSLNVPPTPGATDAGNAMVYCEDSFRDQVLPHHSDMDLIKL
jgi:hypothetical protein